MAITKENTVIVYCSGNSDSESFADYYVSVHELDPSHKIAVPCDSEVEILQSEAEFNSQVLSPLKSAIDSLTTSGKSIFAVVLGYNIPGGFRDGGNIISSTSRVSRINHSFSKKIRNALFDRKNFKLYDSEDSNFALISARIDAPTLELAKEIVDRGRDIFRQFFINGVFYLDPFSDKASKGATEYQNSLLNFESRTLSKLNLETETTVFLDPYIDVVIPFVENDSFVWSWFTDRSSLSFFKETSTSRVFFYNADFDGAETIRNEDSRRWPFLAIKSGYFATAGAMSNPTIEGFLNPSAFFNTILAGGTIGEAYLFSVPFLDWTMTFLGDPLVSFSFPARDLEETEINISESIRLMSRNLARSIAYFIRKSDLIEQARNSVVLSNTIATEVSLLEEIIELFNANDESRISSLYRRPTNELFRYVENARRDQDVTSPQPSFNGFLTVNDLSISELLLDAADNSIEIFDSNILPQGQWDIEVTINNEIPGFTFYHFDLEVYRDEEFNDLVFSISSDEDVSNWFVEKEKNEFTNMDPIGVASNFAGRRIKYISKESEFLPRAEVFFFRIRQKDSELSFNFRDFKDIVFT